MYFKNEEDIFKTLNSNIDGLDSKEAKKRLNDYGQNIILNKMDVFIPMSILILLLFFL